MGRSHRRSHDFPLSVVSAALQDGAYTRTERSVTWAARLTGFHCAVQKGAARLPLVRRRYGRTIRLRQRVWRRISLCAPRSLLEAAAVDQRLGRARRLRDAAGVMRGDG
jgi:hypothetical protein